MVNFKQEIAKLIAKQVTDLEPAEIQSMIEVPQDAKMGDYAFPCFKLAKVMRKAPPLIAKGIAEGMQDAPLFEKVEQVNAYVNMFISKEEFVKDVVEDVLQKEGEYGKTNIGGGIPVIVEFSSPNIAKPFHIGHIQTGIADRLCKKQTGMFVDGSLDRFPVIIFYIPGFDTEFLNIVEQIDRSSVKTCGRYDLVPASHNI